LPALFQGGKSPFISVIGGALRFQYIAFLTKPVMADTTRMEELLKRPLYGMPAKFSAIALLTEIL